MGDAMPVKRISIPNSLASDAWVDVAKTVARCKARGHYGEATYLSCGKGEKQTRDSMQSIRYSRTDNAGLKMLDRLDEEWERTNLRRNFLPQISQGKRRSFVWLTTCRFRCSERPNAFWQM